VFSNEPTRFDLRFRLFGTPVRISPMFWLAELFFGYLYVRYLQNVRPGEDVPLSYLALWMFLLLVSVLTHEYGHVAMARLHGRRGQVNLYALGGKPTFDAPAEKRWQRIAIAAAGPLTGMALYVLVLMIHDQVLPRFGLAFFAQQKGLPVLIRDSVGMLALMNLYYNLMNLIPIYPLDAGEILVELCSGVFPRQGLRLALGLSFLLSASAAGYSLYVWFHPGLPFPKFHPGWTALFVGLMALQNLQLFMQAGQEQSTREEAVAANQEWT
jgi:stage IV sporulation protein FB